MKKLFLLIASFLIITSCGKEPGSVEEALLGTWDLKTLAVGNDVTNLSQEGMSFEITFKSDKTWTAISSNIDLGLNSGNYRIEDKSLYIISAEENGKSVTWEMKKLTSKTFITTESSPTSDPEITNVTTYTFNKAN